ncbi:MAG: hypothetical protein WBZ19_01415, partial [Chthoniobacterales bacterium]
AILCVEPRTINPHEPLDDIRAKLAPEPMPARVVTKQQQDASILYANLLEEAKIRIASIEAVISGRAGLPAPLVREYSYLQLRILCELIALGCLTAHGDIKATQAPKLQKEYAADVIIKRLENLHPNFYPMQFA